MIPTRVDCEWLVGVVDLHLMTTSEFGRRAAKYVDLETVVVIRDSTYTLGDSMESEPDSRPALTEAVADAICQAGYLPVRIRVSSTKHEKWLRSLSFLRSVEIVMDRRLDLEALVDENPPWTFKELPTAHLLARLHATAAQLRRACASCGASGDVEFAFDLPAIGISGAGYLENETPGLEGMYLSHFEVDPQRSDPEMRPYGTKGLLAHKSIGLLHVPRKNASPLLRQERAQFVAEGEPYPVVECDGDHSPTLDASERELRVACLVAQGLAAFLDAEGDKLRKPGTLRGDYEAHWGDQSVAVRIKRPRRKR